MKLPLLKAYKDMVARFGDKYRVSCVRADFIEDQRAARLTSLFTRGGVQGLTKGRIHYAVEALFPFAVKFVDRTLSSVKRCSLTPLIVLQTERVHKMLSDHREEAWVEVKLVSLQSVI